MSSQNLKRRGYDHEKILAATIDYLSLESPVRLPATSVVTRYLPQNWRTLEPSLDGESHLPANGGQIEP